MDGDREWVAGKNSVLKGDSNLKHFDSLLSHTRMILSEVGQELNILRRKSHTRMYY